jgi:hypothetical protein
VVVVVVVVLVVGVVPQPIVSRSHQLVGFFSRFLDTLSRTRDTRNTKHGAPHNREELQNKTETHLTPFDRSDHDDDQLTQTRNSAHTPSARRSVATSFRSLGPVPASPKLLPLDPSKPPSPRSTRESRQNLVAEKITHCFFGCALKSKIQWSVCCVLLCCCCFLFRARFVVCRRFTCSDGVCR